VEDVAWLVTQTVPRVQGVLAFWRVLSVGLGFGLRLGTTYLYTTAALSGRGETALLVYLVVRINTLFPVTCWSLVVGGWRGSSGVWLR
jgi:hypothetical protein